MDLKRTFSYFVILNIVFLISCSTDQINDKGSDGFISSIVLRGAPISIYSEDSLAFTRAGISGSTSVWNIYFDNGVDTVDTMGLFPNGGYQIPFKLPIPNKSTASSVVIKAEGWGTKKNTTYGVYLPYKFANRDFSKIPWDLRSVPLQKSNTDLVASGLRMLYASDTVQASGDTLNTSVYMKGSILQIKCRFPSINPVFVKMMLASSDSKQFTTYSQLNMFQKIPDGNSVYTYGVNQVLTELDHSDHVTILLNNIQKNSSNYVVGYFVVPPCDFTNKTITAYVWDTDGKVYAGSFLRTTSTPILRHTFKNFNITSMTLYTGTVPALNPWEKTENVCPTCTPVAF